MANTQLPSLAKTTIFMLDIGGEGRHRRAWNLNPSRVKTKGSARGKPIPQLLLGRAESIPLPDSSVDCVIVERTPLRRRALEEIKRVITPAGIVILRHAVPPNVAPHRLATEVLPGRIRQRTVKLDGQHVQETVFLNDHASAVQEALSDFARHQG